MTEHGLDELLQLVAKRPRRQAIQHLRHGPTGRTTIDELVEVLAERGPRDDESPDRKHLAIQLYHIHLPKLADHGLVEFDPETRTVQYQPDKQTERVLDRLPEEPSLARP